MMPEPVTLKQLYLLPQLDIGQVQVAIIGLTNDNELTSCTDLKEEAPVVILNGSWIFRKDNKNAANNQRKVYKTQAFKSKGLLNYIIHVTNEWMNRSIQISEERKALK